MISKDLYSQLWFRVLIIVVLALFMGWSVFEKGWLAISILLLLSIIILTGNLVAFLNKTNRQLSYFFEAIQNEDLTLVFPGKGSIKSVRELNKSMNGVNEKLKAIKSELQEQERYYKTILEHLSIGIITFNDSGSIFLANSAAQKLFGLEHLTHIQQLSRVDKKLYSALKTLQPGERNLVSFVGKEGAVQLSLKSTLFKTSRENLQLVAVYDIKNELEAKELESWMKLIRVLTHEIMNSIAPITSLSRSLLGYYDKLEGKAPSEKVVSNTIKGLEVINERGNGLINFVESYRQLTRLPQPEKKPFMVRHLFESMVTLVNSREMTGLLVDFEINPNEMEIVADEKQISQVLINLINNAMEAIKHKANGMIKLKAEVNSNGRPQLWIIDNGAGIPEEIADQIFVPFFTTKETGSGIGLSLSRQVMQMHGGSLKIISSPGQSASAVLTF